MVGIFTVWWQNAAKVPSETSPNFPLFSERGSLPEPLQPVVTLL